MPQIYQGRSIGQNIGEAIGQGAEGFSESYTKGLERLQQAKMKELLRRQEQGRREDFYKQALPPEFQKYAGALAGLSESAGAPFMKEIAAGPRYARDEAALRDTMNYGQQGQPIQEPSPREQLFGQPLQRTFGEQPLFQSEVAPYTKMLNDPGLTGKPQEQTNMPQGAPKQSLGISPQAAAKAADIIMKQRAMQQKGDIARQNQLLTTYKPTTDYYQKTAPIADQTLPYIEKMIELAKTGKVESGAYENIYKLKPLSSYNTETQEFITNGKNVVALASDLGKRGATNQNIKNWENAKASIFQDTPTQLKTLENTADSLNEIRYGRDIIGETISKGALDGKLLGNISKGTSERLKADRERRSASKLEVGSRHASLPDAKLMDVGDEASKGNQNFIVKEVNGEKKWTKKG